MGESIQDMLDNFKYHLHNFMIEDRLFLLFLFVISIVTAFGLGRLAERVSQTTSQNSTQTDVIFTNINSENKETISKEVSSSTKKFVASKSGTKYHYPWCPGAKKIKEENKIFFVDRTEAEAAGYTPAANCKGL